MMKKSCSLMMLDCRWQVQKSKCITGMAGRCSTMTADSPLMRHKLCSQLALHNALCMQNVCLRLCLIKMVSSGIFMLPDIRWWTKCIRALGLHLTMLTVVDLMRLHHQSFNKTVQQNSQCMLHAAHDHAAAHAPWVCHVTWWKLLEQLQSSNIRFTTTLQPSNWVTKGSHNTIV